MKKISKIIAAVTAAALALSMSACGADATTFGSVNGVTIPVGVYINYQYMAYSQAQGMIADEEAAAAETAGETAIVAPDGSAEVTSVSVPFIQKTLEGKNVRDWITDTAIEDVQEFAIINQKFDELGLDFKDGERESVLNYVDQNWEYFSAELTDLGISRESYEEVLLNSMKRQEVFLYYYGKGGEREVPDDVIKNYLLENNARIDYIPMELRDGEGNLLKSEGKAERMAMAEDYIARAESGEDFGTLLVEYNNYYDELKAAAAPETAETAEATETPDTDELDPNAEETVITNDTTITKDSVTPAASVVTRAFEEQVANPGQERYFIVEDPAGEYYYVVKLFDLLADTADFENNRETVISTLYGDEFNELVRSWLPTQEVILNEKAMERYKVEKYEEMFG